MEDRAELLSRIVDNLPVVVAVIGADGQIGYVSPSVQDLLGLTAAEVEHTSIFDYLHTDDHARLVESLAFASGFESGVMGPQRFRYRAEGRGWGVAETWTQNAIGDPSVGGIVAVIQDRTLGAGLEDAQGGLTAGASTVSLLDGLAVAVQGHPIVASGFFDGPDGPLTTSGLPSELLGGSGERAWGGVLRSGQPLALPDLNELSDGVRTVAESEGVVALWAYPVEVPRRGRIEAALVLWRRRPGLPSGNQDFFIRQTTRVAALAFERDRYERDLRHAATHDSLTGVPNRARLMDQLERGVGRQTALLYLDLDHFKPVNDNHGHGTGDEVLKIVAARLEGALRPGDSVARLGGDEFAVVCPGLESSAGAVVLADRLIDKVSKSMQVNGHRIEVGASVGVAWCPNGLSPAVRLIDLADRAMYEAKEAGRSRSILVDATT